MLLRHLAHEISCVYCNGCVRMKELHVCCGVVPSRFLLLGFLCKISRCFCESMAVAELMKWRVPFLLITVWMLLAYNKDLSQVQAGCLAWGHQLPVFHFCGSQPGQDIESLELFAGSAEVSGALQRAPLI